MARSIHSAEMHQRVESGSERSVQPTASLSNEFCGTFRNIGLALGCFDVGQMPLAAGFGDQFEAENAVLGQKHVLLENVHSFNTLGSELLRQSVITVEVLLQWPTKDSAVSVCGEGTGQHGHVTEATLQRLICMQWSESAPEYLDSTYPRCSTSCTRSFVLRRAG